MTEQNIPLTLPSGVNKNVTAEGASGRWTDAKNIVFKDGRPHKRAGNEAYSSVAVSGRIRGSEAWNKTNGDPLYGLGTHLKLYGSTDGIEPTDITPYRFLNEFSNGVSTTTGSGIVSFIINGNSVSTTDLVQFFGNSWNGGSKIGGVTLGREYEVTAVRTNSTSSNLTDPFTTNGSTTCAVTDAAHGRTTGNTVNISGASAVGGVTPSGDYVITVVSVDVYTIELASAATADTGGGTVARFFKSVNDFDAILADNKATLTDPFTTDGSTTCSVADTAHGKATGDMVYFSGASAVGGQTPSGEYELTKVDDDNYTITLSSSATADTGGGSVSRYFIDKATSDVTNSGTAINYVFRETDIITTTSASAVVSLNIAGHGLQPNDGVWITGATAVGGITIDGFYRVTAATDADNFTITHTSAASTGVTGGGSDILVLFEISPGPADRVIAQRGFGKGSFGFGAFGSTELLLDPVYYDPRTVAIDNVGEDAIFCPLGGDIYYWDSSSGNRAEVIPNAPKGIRFAFQTEERHLHALGLPGDPMAFGWAAQNEVNTWEATSTNTANQERQLREGSALIAGCTVQDGMNLIWSDTTCYEHQYTGSQFIYDTEIAAHNSGIVGPMAFCKTPIGPMWMSWTQFLLWNGGVQSIPRSEDLESWVYDQIDPLQLSKSFLIFNAVTNSVHAYFVPVQSGEPTKYVIINLDDWSWVNGEERRTSGMFFDQGAKNPIQADIDGILYKHEVGVNDNGAAADTYIEYAAIQLARGNVSHNIFGIDGNFIRQTGDVEFEINTYDRNQNVIEETETATITTTDEVTDLRVHGRRHTGKFKQNLVDGDFAIDVPSVLIDAAGAKR